MHRAIIIIIGFFFIFGCGQKEKKVRIGINPWPGYSFFYYAAHKGYFKEEGVSVEIVPTKSLGHSLELYQQGKIDGMGCTLIELIQASKGKNNPPKAIFVSDFSNGGDVILASNNIKIIQDLKHKKVGLEKNSLNSFMLYKALQKTNLNIQDIQLVEIHQDQMPQAMQSQQIDVVISYPPSSVKILEQKTGHTIFTSKEIPKQVVDVITLQSKFITENSHLTKGLIRAYHRAIDDYYSDPLKVSKVIAPKINLTPKDFNAILNEEIHVPNLLEQAIFIGPEGNIFELLKETQNVLLKTQQLKQPLQDLNSLITTQPALEVMHRYKQQSQSN